jgi:hypothetical protein
VQFSQLELAEICELAGIPDSFANIRKALQVAHDGLKRSGRDFTPADLVEALEDLAGFGGGEIGAEGGYAPFDPLAAGADLADAAAGADGGEPATDSIDPDEWFPPGDRARQALEARGPAGRGGRKGGAAGGAAGRPPSPDAVSGASKAVKYVEFLAAQRIWGFQDVPMDDLLAPMTLSAVDLAGIDRKIADFVVTKIVREVWQQATRYGLSRPVFLVLEEAHNFIPSGPEQGNAARWIKRIASEGRKFGIFLVLVTQRPYKVHQDTLSQCGSQVIMRLTNPEDQNAVRRASESISEDLLADLPGLNVGEAVVLGPLARVPVMVRVGRRESMEGGSDIDVVERLAAARAEAVTRRYVDEHKAGQAARGRTAWVEDV